jgi:serine protease SohB
MCDDAPVRKSRLVGLWRAALVVAIVCVVGAAWRAGLAESEAAKTPSVNVLRLDGVIANGEGLNITDLRGQIDRAYKGAPLMVALVVNSPGGSPSQSEEIHNYIRHKADETGVPTITFIEDIGASGGYYVSLAGDKIYASNRQSIIGSIGVVSSGFNLRKAAQSVGVDHWVVAHGAHKHHLDPFEAMTDADKTWITGLQNAIFEVFKNHVVARRKAEGHAIRPEEYAGLFNGDVWIGEDAVKKGLADGVIDVYAYVAKTYGEKTPIRYIEPEADFTDEIIKKMSTRFGGVVATAAARAEFGL